MSTGSHSEVQLENEHFRVTKWTIEPGGAIPMYSDYMAHAMKPELCVNLHLKAYWRGPGEDYRMVGLPEGQ